MNGLSAGPEALELSDTTTQQFPTHVLNLGLGVDSVCVLLRWLNDPQSRTFALDDLVVVTAILGDEWASTMDLCERFLLPAMTRHRVRYVQIGRTHLHTTRAGDGVTVLSDTRTPTRFYTEGAYRLSTEMLTVGTVPQLGNRRCSIRAKGEPIDAILPKLTGGRTFVQYMGFEFNEQSRAQRDSRYDNTTRRGAYPLIEWGWTRQDALDYIHSVTGVQWPKSACVMCPYALASKAGRVTAIERYAAEPEAAIHALTIEHVALALNPNQSLMAGARLVDAIAAAGHAGIIAEFSDRISELSHGVYEVRRVARPRAGTTPMVARSVAKLHTGTRAEALAVLASMPGSREVGADGIVRMVARPRGESAPWAEQYFVACPATVESKARPSFGRMWREVTGEDGLF